jgi:hypothetical protein
MNDPLSRGLIGGLLLAILALEFVIFGWGVTTGYQAGQKHAGAACVAPIEKALP